MSKPSVVFIPAKCNKTGKDFFIREDLAADGMWVRTYGLTTLPAGSGGSSSEAVVDYSNHRVGPQYKCPHCGNVRIFTCGSSDCNAAACCYDGGDTWHCPITGQCGSFSGSTISTVSGKGGKGQI